jgi:formiminotetrahydrofolate cyclodeaminase
MNLSQTLAEYFKSLSSASPTPGGGNVAAICGALSASLGAMVCNLTIGKKKYAQVEFEIIGLKEKLENLRNRFFELAGKDNAAFENVMVAFKLPKETEHEKELRSKQIEEATLHAAEIPSEVIKSSGELIPLISMVIEKGNRNSLSDAGVAVSLTRTAAESAYLNVLINCASLSNQTIALEIRKRADILMEEIRVNCEHLITTVIRSIEAG